MGMRFRKSIKILPGIRVNLGMSGLSATIGARGASVSVGNRGMYSNIGIPGSGISFRNKLGSNSKQNDRLFEKQQRLDELSINERSKSVVLDLNEDGSISYKDKDGLELSKGDISLVWKQKPEIVTEWLKKESINLNDMDLISTIHLDMPHPNNEPEIEIIEFSELFPEKPIMEVSKKPSLFQSIFSSKAKNKYQEEVFKNNEIYNSQISKWNDDVSEYKARELEFNKQQKEIHDSFPEKIRNDINIMTEYLEKVYKNLSWARETLISYDINKDTNAAYIDIDLPEIEDIPKKTSSISANGKKLNIKQKTDKQIRLEYSSHVHAIALRLAGFTFATLPSIDLVVISGYSQRRDKSTAQINDEYLFSIKFNREKFSKINFEEIEYLDTVQSFENFEYIRQLSATGLFKPIEPFNQDINL